MIWNNGIDLTDEAVCEECLCAGGGDATLKGQRFEMA